MKQPIEQPKPIDNNYFEYILALNCTTNANYLSSVVEHLNIEYFNNKDVKLYIGILQDFFKKRGVLPNTSEIKLYLNNEQDARLYKDLLLTFKEMDKSYNIEELLTNTETFLKERAICNAVKKTIDDVTVKHGTIDAKSILGTFEKACNISLHDNLGHDYFNNVDTHIKDLTVPEKYLSSGFNWIDENLNGGFLSDGRSMYIFSASPNAGKSIFLSNIAINILKQNKKVILISLEMSEMIYSKRISSQLTDLPINNLKGNIEELQNRITKFKEEHPAASLIIKEFPPRSITCQQLKFYLESVIKKLQIKFDAIIIDYLTLLTVPKSNSSLYQDGKEISEGLRALSYFFSCPVISACQLNRGATDTPDPGMETLGESYAIGMTSDVIFSLQSTDAEKELGIINVGIMRNRFGKNFGRKPFQIDYNTLKVSETDSLFGNANNMDIQNKLENLITNKEFPNI